MTETQAEALEALLRRRSGDNDLPRYVPSVRLADALARGDDPLHVLAYFLDLGVRIASLEELFAACVDPAEEELEAYRIEAGIAVYLPVDGQWAVFTR